MRRLSAHEKQLVRDPTKRHKWILFQLAIQGRSLSALARDTGVAPQTLRTALLRTYPRMERVLADALDLEPAILFPERYDADGLPIYRMGRPKKSTANKAKNNTHKAGCNVKDRRVA